MCSESVCNMWHSFSHGQDSQVQGSKGGNISGITHYDPSDPLAKQLLLIAMTMNFWLKSSSFKGKNASTRRHNNDSTEQEVKIATQPLWVSHAFESAGKERHYHSGWVD